MKQLATFGLFFILFSSLAHASYPRQKIILSGALQKNKTTILSVEDLENFQTPSTIKIFDPYNKNLETVFYGFYLKDFAKAYGSNDFKALRIGAIDGYKIDVSKDDIEKNNLFLSFKDKSNYFTVDRMGPARLVAPVKGIINKDLLLKIGVNWVWQIKTIEFLR